MDNRTSVISGGTYATCTSVRKGNWKLMRFYGEGATPAENGYELYNLGKDISETNSLARKMREKVKELDALIDEFLRETGSLVPIPNPNYKGNSIAESKKKNQKQKKSEAIAAPAALNKNRL